MAEPGPRLPVVPSELRSAIVQHGPCRLKGPLPISSENGNRSIFSEKHYFHHISQSCWLFGGHRSVVQKEWATGVSGNLKNFGVKIISHEKTQAHLDASIAFGRRKAGQRTDRVQEQATKIQRRPSGGMISFGS